MAEAQMLKNVIQRCFRHQIHEIFDRKAPWLPTFEIFGLLFESGADRSPILKMRLELSLGQSLSKFVKIGRLDLDI
jgi:hypothetical protein